MAVASLTTDNFAEGVRKTTETPPRVSVYDVIAKVKGCSGDVACVTFRRLLATDFVPECEEVLQNIEVGTTCSHCIFPGRGQRDTPVTDAKGIIDIAKRISDARSLVVADRKLQACMGGVGAVVRSMR